MSVPAFIDITEEDQVQLKSFKKITKRPLVEEPPVVLQSIRVC